MGLDIMALVAFREHPDRYEVSFHWLLLSWIKLIDKFIDMVGKFCAGHFYLTIFRKQRDFCYYNRIQLLCQSPLSDRNMIYLFCIFDLLLDTNCHFL